MLLKKSVPTDKKELDIENLADRLIYRDEHEGSKSGQNLSETFHLADVFIDGISIDIMEHKIVRFFNAFFGKNDISPSKDEFGMYIAKSASLRSADLSRQVGAAIIAEDGEIVTQSCNEVPNRWRKLLGWRNP